MKRLLLNCLLVWAAFTWPASAQYWTDSLDLPIRTSAANPAETVSTRFRIWLPPGGETCRSVLLVSARGVGFNNGADGSGLYGRNAAFRFALHPSIRSMATRTRTALVLFQGLGSDAGLVTSFDPGLGHGDSLESALRKLGNRVNRPEIQWLPWMAFGHSLGSLFSEGLAFWKPDRVVATLVYQSGGPLNTPGWNSPFNPTMSLSQVPVLVANGELEGPDINNNQGGFFAETGFSRVREKRALGWPCQILIRRNGSHSVLFPQEAGMMADFLEKCLALRLPPGGGVPTQEVSCLPLPANTGWLGKMSRYNGFDPRVQAFAADSASGFSWLPDSAYARNWREYHQTPLSFTVSRPGPYCAGDTLTVYYQHSGTGAYGPGNVFRLEMSNIRGDFDGYSFPLRIAGSVQSRNTIGSFRVQIPENLQRSPQTAATPMRYRFRLVSTLPVRESNAGPELSIGLCNTPPFPLYTFHANGGIPPELCRGSGDTLLLGVSRLSTQTLNADNTLSFQISDSLGSFEQAQTVATFPNETLSGSGSTVTRNFRVGVPTSLPSGKGYRFRAVCSSPALVSAQTGTDLRIREPETRIWEENGLFWAAPGVQYQWFRDGQPVEGAVFAMVSSALPGVYHCRIGSGCCVNETDSVLVTGLGQREWPEPGPMIFPNPARDRVRVLDRKNEEIEEMAWVFPDGRKTAPLSKTEEGWVRLPAGYRGVLLLQIRTRTGTYGHRVLVLP